MLQKLASMQPYALSLMRIIFAFDFLAWGAQKLFGAFGGMGGSGAAASVGSIYWIAGGIELVGGAFLLLGLFTRPVAFILAGEMAVAYFKAHPAQGFLPKLNGGELATLYCFAYLYICTSG